MTDRIDKLGTNIDTLNREVGMMKTAAWYWLRLVDQDVSKDSTPRFASIIVEEDGSINYYGSSAKFYFEEPGFDYYYSIINNDVDGALQIGLKDSTGNYTQANFTRSNITFWASTKLTFDSDENDAQLEVRTDKEDGRAYLQLDGDAHEWELSLEGGNGDRLSIINGDGGSSVMDFLTTGNVVFDKGLTVNEGGGDNDSRIEGDTDANLVYVDAGNDRVGIGTNTPGALLDVDGDLDVGGDLDVTGDATAANLWKEYSASLNDDQATSFTPPWSTGILIIYHTAGAYYAIVSYRTPATSSITSMVASSNIATTTGALTGTDGTDTKLNISAHTDGKIYIENRLGSGTAVRVLYMGI